MTAARILLAALTLAAALPAPAQISWRHYRPTNTGILGDYVQTILLDEQDRPWIAAYTPFWEEGGMSRMNGDGTWKVVSSFDHPEIGSPRFNDMIRGADGVMWIGTYDGLLRYDPAAAPPQSSLHLYTPANSGIVGGRVYDVDLAPDNTLWMAIYDVTGPGGGLARLDLATGAWQTWTTANGLPWGGQWPNWDNLGQVAVLPDVDGQGGYTVWFSSATNLGCGTYRSGTFQWLGSPQNPPPGLYPLELMGTDSVDELGNLWVLTSQGLARRSPDGQYTVVGYPAGLDTEVAKVVALRNGRAALGTYYADVFIWDGGWSHIGNWGSVNHTYALVEDSDGGIWAGGIGGAAHYQNGSWQRYRLTNTGMVGFFTNAIDFAPDGRVFINGNAGPGVGGFDIFNGERWTCVNDYNAGLGPAWGLPSDDVAALCVRANGHAAVAPAGSQGLLDWDGSSFTYLIPQGVDILEVDEDGLGRLWVAHYGNSGASVIDGTQVTHFGSNDSPLPAGSIGSIEVDPLDPSFVWIATAFGVARTDGETWTVYPRELLGLNQNTIAHLLSCAAPHPDGSVWIGSYSGVYRFVPATGQYTRHHKTNSALPSNDVHQVHIPPDGSVWVGTFDQVWPYPGGLTHFEGDAGTHYSTANSPLPHNQLGVLNSRAVAGGYELWVGTASEAVAVLTVETGNACPADWNGDQSVNSSDISAFLTAWLGSVQGGTLDADFDGDGAVNSSDISAFLTAWLGAVQQGC